jgi:outer membrane lipoprotein-sorting protein
MIPFAFVVQGGPMGRIVARLQDVKFNVNIPASTFRAAAK